MTFHCGTSSSGEEPEALVKEPRDLGRTHRDHPRRGKLDGERDPVEAPTDLRDHVQVAASRSEVGLRTAARAR